MSYIKLNRGVFITKMACAIILASMTWMTGAYARTLSEIKQSGVLHIGVLVTYPPFGFLDDQNKPAGYDVQLGAALAGELGVDPEFSAVSVPNRIPFLVSDKIDVLVAALGITPERAAQIDFSEPSAAVDRVVYSRKDRPIKTLDDLAGLSIGLGRGSTEDVILSKSAPKGASIQRFDDDPATVQAFLSGQSDAIITSSLIIAELAKRQDVSQYEVKFVMQRLIHGVGIRKGNAELKGAVNQFLAESKRTGKLDALHQQWLGYPFSAEQ
jgi:polar amino acid transport system substrate-binding protein